jgi:hypothetical protein
MRRDAQPTWRVAVQRAAVEAERRCKRLGWEPRQPVLKERLEGLPERSEASEQIVMIHLCQKAVCGNL